MDSSNSNSSINQTAVVPPTYSAASSTSSNDPSFLIIGLLMQAMLSAPGIIPNIAIVYITFKHKSIQTIYGWLLCHAAFWGALGGFSFGLPLVLVSFRQKIPLLPCFFVQFYDSIGLFQNVLLFLAISLDRLFAICMPISYMYVTVKHTKAIVIGTSLIATAMNYVKFHFLLLYALSNPNLPVYCLTSDLIAGPVAEPIYKLIGNLSRLAGANNALVLYICSAHYREIFCKEFSCLVRLDELSSSTRVHNLAAGSTTANPPQRQTGSS